MHDAARTWRGAVVRGTTRRPFHWVTRRRAPSWPPPDRERTTRAGGAGARPPRAMVWRRRFSSGHSVVIQASSGATWRRGRPPHPRAGRGRRPSPRSRGRASEAGPRRWSRPPPPARPPGPGAARRVHHPLHGLRRPEPAGVRHPGGEAAVAASSAPSRPRRPARWRPGQGPPGRAGRNGSRPSAVTARAATCSSTRRPAQGRAGRRVEGPSISSFSWGRGVTALPRRLASDGGCSV